MKNESSVNESTAVSGASATLTRCGTTIVSEERWLPIPGFEGKYEVSDSGKVRHTKRPDKTLSPLNNGAGYRQVSLVCDSGKIVKRYIHWAVLSAFVGPRPSGYYACHGDGDRSNNCLSNLRWDTVSNNLKDKRAHGTAIMGEQHMWTTKFNTKFAKEAKRMLATGFTHEEIAKNFGVSRSQISALSCGLVWAHIEVESFYTKPEFDNQ